ncbi:hypothetical protein LCGC14_0751090 [marine sediment metagenome]|uniref:Uncharacterized protein n=1 Tax=marine sediment metagenome TaxID=412755 RepID=A0A0F9Q866_9ZZZZ|nr:hypothetical protein [Methylophaga sp.]HEC59001.1 hypothetical protein [Methylophaga sp.]
MKQDIINKVESDFDEPKEVIRILESMESMNRGPIEDRAYRSIIFLAHGSRDKLNHYIDLAFKDSRDLYLQAEYEDPEVKKYDFNNTFNEQGL